jgi:hypothetical protein
MANQKGLLGKYGLTILDVLLLALLSGALTYLSLPWLVKVSMAISKSLEPNPGADIQPIGVFSFFLAMIWGGTIIFFVYFVLAWYALGKLPDRGKLFARLGIVMLFMPILIQAAMRGPREYFYRLVNPASREARERLEAKRELERRLRASGVLSVQREIDGIRVSNNSDQPVRVQVEFISRSGQYIVECSPSQSGAFPPSPSDEEMNLSAREAHLYRFSDARPIAGTLLSCGFEDYWVWGWDEKGAPVYLSEKAMVRGAH